MTVSKRDKPTAVPVPASVRRYSRLAAEGKVRLTPFTTDDIDRRPVYASARPGSPIQTVIDMKDDDARSR